MFQLPQDIQKKIWEFDSTYKNLMNICLLELKYSSPFWCVRTTASSIPNNQNKYIHYLHTSKKLAYYWNNDYKKRVIERGRRIPNISQEMNYWMRDEFICDIYEHQHKRILQNIKNYKPIYSKVDLTNSNGSLKVFFKENMEPTVSLSRKERGAYLLYN